MLSCVPRWLPSVRSRRSRTPRKQRPMNRFGARKTRCDHAASSLALAHHDLQDMNKVKEELKAKEIIKEAEQRRRGNVFPTRLVLIRYDDVSKTRPTMPKPRRLYARRLKRTRKPGLKKRRGKRHYGRDDRSLMHLHLRLPQLPPHPLHPLVLQLRGKTSRTHGSRLGLRVGETRT